MLEGRGIDFGKAGFFGAGRSRAVSCKEEVEYFLAFEVG